MDSTELRILLFILGVAFVAGIYFWDRRKHVDSRFHNLQSKRKARRHHASHDPSVFRNDEKQSTADFDTNPEPDSNPEYGSVSVSKSASISSETNELSSTGSAVNSDDDFEIIVRNDKNEDLQFDSSKMTH